MLTEQYDARSCCNRHAKLLTSGWCIHIRLMHPWYNYTLRSSTARRKNDGFKKRSGFLLGPGPKGNFSELVFNFRWCMILAIWPKCQPTTLHVNNAFRTTEKISASNRRNLRGSVDLYCRDREGMAAKNQWSQLLLTKKGYLRYIQN